MPWLMPSVRIIVLMPMTSPRMFSSGPPELPRLIAASVWMKSSVRPLDDRRRAADGADDAHRHGVRQAERVADGHDPVARRHLRESPNLAADSGALRQLGDLQQRRVGELVAADDLRRQAVVGSCMLRQADLDGRGVSTTWLLVRM